MKSEPEERLLDIFFILLFFKAVMCFIYQHCNYDGNAFSNTFQTAKTQLQILMKKFTGSFFSFIYFCIYIIIYSLFF